MYSDDGNVGITFFAKLSSPLAIATKNYLPLTTCVRKTATLWVDMSTYMRGQRNLQHVSILKGL
jgi:hypothetical protein